MMVSGIIPVLHSPRLLQSGIVKLTFAGSVTRAALWRFVQTISCANLSRTKSFAESKFARFVELPGDEKAIRNRPLTTGCF
jgi:hypothetical protein